MNLKKRLISIVTLGLAVGLTWAAAPTARAGKADTGQVSPGKVVAPPSAARKLVGTWRMVALEHAGNRRPFPSHVSFTLTLRADGTLSLVNVPNSAQLNKARWSVKGKHVVLTMNKKVQTLAYRLSANELSVAMPGNTRYRIILHRVSKRA